jgi:hypothetical protein
MTGFEALQAQFEQAGPVLYLVGYVLVLAYTRRHELRRRATFAPAVLDLLGGIALSVPALAWLDERVADRVSETLLRVLFVLGLVSLAWFTRADVAKARANPRLPFHLRGRFALIALAASLIGAAPDVWWGILALVHAPRS